MKLTCDSCASKNNCLHEEAFNHILDICSVAVLKENLVVLCAYYENEWRFDM